MSVTIEEPSAEMAGRLREHLKLMWTAPMKPGEQPCQAVPVGLLRAAIERLATAPNPHPLDGKLEPEARDGVSSPSEAALVSLAVSMKRIADLLDGTTVGICVTETVLGGKRPQ